MSSFSFYFLLIYSSVVVWVVVIKMMMVRIATLFSYLKLTYK